MSKVIGIIETDKLRNGTELMKGNTNLRRVKTNFTKLRVGDEMFRGCTNLTDFEGDLGDEFAIPKSLESAKYMFAESGLINFTGKINSYSSLDAEGMFQNTNITTSPWEVIDNIGCVKKLFNGCKKLESVTISYRIDLGVDVSYLCNGCESLSYADIQYLDARNTEHMFHGCGTKITDPENPIYWNGLTVNIDSFNGMLLNADYMFAGLEDVVISTTQGTGILWDSFFHVAFAPSLTITGKGTFPQMPIMSFANIINGRSINDKHTYDFIFDMIMKSNGAESYFVGNVVLGLYYDSENEIKTVDYLKNRGCTLQQVKASNDYFYTEYNVSLPNNIGTMMTMKAYISLI